MAGAQRHAAPRIERDTHAARGAARAASNAAPRRSTSCTIGAEHALEGARAFVLGCSLLFGSLARIAPRQFAKGRRRNAPARRAPPAATWHGGTPRRLHRLVVAFSRCKVQRSRSLAVSKLYVSPLLQQAGDSVRVARVSRVDKAYPQRGCRFLLGGSGVRSGVLGAQRLAARHSGFLIFVRAQRRQVDQIAVCLSLCALQLLHLVGRELSHHLHFRRGLRAWKRRAVHRNVRCAVLRMHVRRAGGSCAGAAWRTVQSVEGAVPAQGVRGPPPPGYAALIEHAHEKRTRRCLQHTPPPKLRRSQRAPDSTGSVRSTPPERTRE